jgi:CheY-like chemotaxis protein
VQARHVLVIEDNRDAADALCDLLELEGHEVNLAYDGLQGLARARASRSDVVLCDIGLPEMDGFEVARAIRADPALTRLTLVALTGYAQPEDVAQAKQAGFDMHLAKPLAVEQLRRVLAMAPTQDSTT